METELIVSAAQAQALTAQLRTLEPSWRPPASLFSTAQGEITHYRAVAASATARLDALNQQPIIRPTRNVLSPGGREIGYRARGAGENIRTVSRSVFDRVHDGLMAGSVPGFSAVQNYNGAMFRRTNGIVWGIRRSRKNDWTIDILRSTDPNVPPNYKIHFK